MNVLDMADRDRILNLLRRKWSIRSVARETGHRHETIRRYGIEAGILTPRAEAKSHTRASEEPTGSARTTRSSVEAHRAFIEAELAKGRNAKAISQDLGAHHGYTGSYDAVKRFARTLRQRDPKVHCRFETAAKVDVRVSSPGESHPQALAEPDVSLSAHPAPVMEPPT